MNNLESALRDQFPNYHPVITSRGISALYLALSAIRSRYGPGEVIVSASVCPSVAMAVIYSGLVPVFCDVDIDTFCLSCDSIASRLSENTRAIIVVYLFGKAIDIEAICEMASRKGILVIEDLAHAIGGTWNNKALGCFGDFSVISFNDIKVLSGAAGALTVRNEEFISTITTIKSKLPPPLGELERKELASSFRNLTHGLFDALRSRGANEAIAFFSKLSEYYKRLFICNSGVLANDSIRHCVEAVVKLPLERQRRHENYKLYATYLDEKVEFIRFSESEICWRLPVMLKNHSDQLLVINRIRKMNRLVSNHYFPASLLFGDNTLPRAREIGLRAVNFWVDGMSTPEDIEAICHVVNTISGTDI